VPTPSDNHLVFWRGEDVLLEFSPTDATDITGWALLFTIADGAGTEILTGSTGGGEVEITDAGLGEFEVTFTRAQTSDLELGEYVWDVWKTTSGENWRLAGGTLSVPRSARNPA
jgi:hypothetical protein